jgi:phosphatidylserine/phosphatidylglycerophosphate/cardiolipin synthase-like enzyme
MMWFRHGWILALLCLGTVVLPMQGAVVINEIMYNPSDALGDDSDYEYIELVNTGSAAVNVSGWSFTSGTFFTFPVGTSVGAGQYLVVCANVDSMESMYGIGNTVGNFENRLNNTGETIRLENASSTVIDEVTYYDTSPWPVEPDGNGPSLELINYHLDNSLAENWAASDSFGTPGLVNSVFVAGDTVKYFDLYFNQIVHTSFATETMANGLVPLAPELTDVVNSAVGSLDLCAYNLTDGALTSAIIGAHNLGVLVRFITDDEHRNSQTAALESAGITVIDDSYGLNSGSGYMHNKFAVADYLGAGEVANTVWTGSYNWSLDGSTVNANNAIAITDTGLAGAFTDEFNEMWGSSGPTPNPALSRFGSRKYDNITHVFDIAGHSVEVYMSPGDGIHTAIINAIGTADYEIAFCILAFTRDDIMLAMKAKWDDNINYPDFWVEGVFDNGNAGTSYSQWWNMSGQGGSYPWSPPADVWIDNLPTGLLHHKYMIIDGEHPGSDPMVITGSANWSNNAVYNNDENIVIIHDAEVANLYVQEFRARKSQAMGNVPPIYDVQYPQLSGSSSPYAGQTVTVTGVITASFPDVSVRRYFLQGPQSGAWWGIHIYESGAGSNFVVGDSVEVRGIVQEASGLTQVANPTYTAHGTAEYFPDAMPVSTYDVSIEESLESVLVQVENVTVVSTSPHGTWEVDDGSGACTVGNMGSYSYVPTVGDVITELRGVVTYGSGLFRLEPRTDDDFDLTPPPVEGLVVQRLGNTIVLQWEAVAGNPLYRIYRDVTPDFIPSPSTLIDSTASTLWMDVNVLAGGNDRKFYRITAEY